MARLAVIPVEEEQGEGTHNEEEEDPHTEASVVLNGLGWGRGEPSLSQGCGGLSVPVSCSHTQTTLTSAGQRPPALPRPAQPPVGAVQPSQGLLHPC